MASASYHHGNLRQALLDHGVALARAGGPDAVVLRDVQRLAGVSNSAAYRHYADRQALLGAVKAHVTAQMGAAMAAALDAVGAGESREDRALARFRACGQSYIDFAVSEPGLFRTASAPDGTESTDEAVPADRHPFLILRCCLDELVSVGMLDNTRRDGFDEAAWAAVHGAATLFIDGPLRTVGPDRRQLITDRLLDVIGAGLR
ncbi:regulatory protein TetR [Mycolicibacterium rhodesiae JS60]|nr:regulatory protein TetR [Mycolicibacterium rhodesiae JS60]